MVIIFHRTLAMTFIIDYLKTTHLLICHTRSLYSSPLLLGQIKLSQRSLCQSRCCPQTEGCRQLNQLHSSLGRTFAATCGQEVLHQLFTGELHSRKQKATNSSANTTTYATFVSYLKFLKCFLTSTSIVNCINEFKT